MKSLFKKFAAALGVLAGVLVITLALAVAFAPAAHAGEVQDSAGYTAQSRAVADQLEALAESSASEDCAVVASDLASADEANPYLAGLSTDERRRVAVRVEVAPNGQATYSVVAFAAPQWSTQEELEAEPALAANYTFQETLEEAWDEMYEVANVLSYNIDKDDFTTAYLEATLETPQQFNVTLYWYYWWDDNGVTMQVKPDYLVTDKATYKQKKAAYEERVSEALASLPCGATDLAKVYLLHNWICDHAQYATDEYNANEKSAFDENGKFLGWDHYVYPGIYSCYAILVEGRGVCAGYADALSDLLNRVGVENANLKVDAMNHDWNMVKIDGSWYHIDATWDDSDYVTGDGVWTHKISYWCFMKSDTGLTDAEHYGWENGPNATYPSYGWDQSMAATNTQYDDLYTDYWRDTYDPTAGTQASSAHQWDGGKVTKEASCTTTGIKTYTCTKCGVTKTETIAAKGGSHTWSSWQMVRAATCIDEGIRKRTCTKCPEVQQELIDIDKNNHKWDAGKVTKAATCTSEGTKLYTCTRTDCGATKTEKLAKKGHTWGAWKTTKAATYKEAGSKERSCSVCGTKETQTIAKLGSVTMHRLYNPYSGEHLYTSDAKELNSLKSIGWKYEGLAWTAPSKSNTPVYRLYNKYSGDHHYTTNKGEYDACVSQGWNGEGIGFYSDDAKGVTVYRLYNKYLTAGTHHYTTSKTEYDYLGKIGWSQENIGWYGLKL